MLKTHISCSPLASPISAFPASEVPGAVSRCGWLIRQDGLRHGFGQDALVFLVCIGHIVNARELVEYPGGLHSARHFVQLCLDSFTEVWLHQQSSCHQVHCLLLHLLDLMLFLDGLVHPD